MRVCRDQRGSWLYSLKKLIISNRGAEDGDLRKDGHPQDHVEHEAAPAEAEPPQRVGGQASPRRATPR